MKSLKNLCIVPAVVVFSNHPDIKKQIFSSSILSLKSSEEDFKRWSDTLQDLGSEILNGYDPRLKLILPLQLIPLIGTEMLHWAEQLKSCFNIEYSFTQNFMRSSFFTSKGIFKEIKAAKQLIMEPSFPLVLKYKIACHFYLRGSVIKIWMDINASDDPCVPINYSENTVDTTLLWSKYINDCFDFGPASCFVNFNLEKRVFKNATKNLSVVMFKFILRDILKTPKNDQSEDEEEGEVEIDVEKYGVKDESDENEDENNEDEDEHVEYKDEIEDENSKKYKSKYCIMELLLEENWTKRISHLMPLYSRPVQTFLEVRNLSFKLLFSRKFKIHRDISITLYKSLIENYEEKYIKYFKTDYGLLSCFLMWPCQDLFMKLATPIFHLIEERNFYSLMHHLVDLSQDPILKHTYNYPQLLREFWIKSPSNLKEYLIKVECKKIVHDFLYIKPVYIRENMQLKGYLLKKIVLGNNSNDVDEQSFQLILESATTEEKFAILKAQGFYSVSELIYLKKFQLADMFINNLTTNERTKMEFKRRCLVDTFFLYTFLNETFDMADHFVNWAFSSADKIDDVKNEIFSLFTLYRVTHHFLMSRCSPTHLHKIFKWLGKSDEDIKEWKNSLVFGEEYAKCFLSPGEKELGNRFDLFMEFLGYDEQKKLVILNNMLHFITPQIPFILFSRRKVDKLIQSRILYLCSNNKSLVNNFINNLRVCCANIIEEKLCIFCEKNTNVSYSEDESRYFCMLHPSRKMITSETVDRRCSSFLEELHNMISEQESERILKLIDSLKEISVV